MSKIPGSAQHDMFADFVPARTPGTLGHLDAGDPDILAAAGDTPGSLGINDHASILADGGLAFIGVGRPIAGPPSAESLPVGVPELVNIVKSSKTGLALYAKAVGVNQRREPVIKLGRAEFGGFVDTDNGVITLDERLDKCKAIDVLVQELTNLASKPDFDLLDSQTIKGDVSRADYIRRTEGIEFRGLQNILRVFDETKRKTGCQTCTRDYQRKYAENLKGFLKYMGSDEYGKKHEEKIGARWDLGAKREYDKKHQKK
jgi:hypothetical protein